MSLTYLSILLVSILGMVIIDYRFKLVFFRDWKLAAKIFTLLLAYFLLWDLAGIELGIFFSGESEYMTNIYLLPELPIEEPLFLILLIYTPLNIYTFSRKKMA